MKFNSYIWFRILILISISICIISSLILLIIRLDEIADISYFIIITPLIIFYSTSIFFSLIYIIYLLIHGKSIFHLFQIFGISIINGGALLSSIRIAERFQFLLHRTYLNLLLPFIIGLIIALILTLISIFYDNSRIIKKKKKIKK